MTDPLCRKRKLAESFIHVPCEYSVRKIKPPQAVCIGMYGPRWLGGLSAGLLIKWFRVRLPPEAEIFSIVNGVPLHTAFHRPLTEILLKKT